MSLPVRLLLFATAVACLPVSPAVHARPESERVFLLVAKPGMLDLNFAETVVLLMRADDSGPLGIILNRPTRFELRALYPERAELKDRDDLVFFGGPVQPDALLFAFRSPVKPPKGLFVTEDIYISGFSEVLNDLLQHPENAKQQRFFAGYAGWAAGQLEYEIARGGWYVLPLDVNAIFEMNPLTMYGELLKRASVPRIETRHGNDSITVTAERRH
jgi:putative transcriptional regulator